MNKFCILALLFSIPATSHSTIDGLKKHPYAQQLIEPKDEDAITLKQDQDTIFSASKHLEHVRIQISLNNLKVEDWEKTQKTYNQLTQLKKHLEDTSAWMDEEDKRSYAQYAQNEVYVLLDKIKDLAKLSLPQS